MSGEIIGAWIAVFLTLAIFSYLYKDNAFYKIAEHLFVGISAGYWTSMFFWTQIQPNLFGRLWPSSHYNADSFWYSIYNGLSWFSSSVFPVGGIDKGHELHLIYLIPFALGIMMLLSVVNQWSWFARWGIAYTVGMAAGLRAYGYLNSNVIAQVRNSTLNFSDPDLPVFALIGNSYFNGLLLLIGTIAGLLYFYFSKEHKGTFGKVARVGIYFLMVSFGASFGFAVMGRISLLIGRFVDLITYNGAEYHHATSWILISMIILLGYSTFKNDNHGETPVE
ncbi:MAG: hypothetical protein HOK52_05960 [Candidatus Marinimicrobia bacterium]|nr:hypothetical protein [Candidatus Neomarinimicrobiota bacterium]MBT3937597.1 hypothetical protein [Candidatus Neomarinimicrobiota bacterium]MBT3960696.1 hypothetical protein [Candidatus Neomarinimicrobiota bacterium]MBT4382886.1 hypothetical protein [Candidatus Neomarinimicrobiota bacterium]MBT4635086.1 hypothetical protein [Candidatus Neomarinimicrobiota bacterium]